MREETSLVLKRDALGRVRVTRERREAVVTAAVVMHLGGGVSIELTEAGQIPLAASLILSLQKPC